MANDDHSWMALATVIPLTYQGTEHTWPTLEALSANFPSENSDLIVYSDARADEIAIAGVKETQAMLADIKGLTSGGSSSRQ